MPTLYWILLAAFGAIPISYFIYDVMITKISEKSKRKRYFNDTLNMNNHFRL